MKWCGYPSGVAVSFLAGAGIHARPSGRGSAAPLPKNSIIPVASCSLDFRLRLLLLTLPRLLFDLLLFLRYGVQSSARLGLPFFFRAVGGILAARGLSSLLILTQSVVSLFRLKPKALADIVVARFD